MRHHAREIRVYQKVVIRTEGSIQQTDEDGIRMQANLIGTKGVTITGIQQAEAPTMLRVRHMPQYLTGQNTIIIPFQRQKECHATVPTLWINIIPIKPKLL